jgi:hypothetical protein
MAVTNNRKRNRIIREVGLYFAEQGKVSTFYEYKSDGRRPKGMSPAYIMSNFKGWEHFLQYFKALEPELWNLANGIKPEPVKPKPVVKKPAVKKPIAPAKPKVAKPAKVKVEK